MYIHVQACRDINLIYAYLYCCCGGKGAVKCYLICSCNRMFYMWNYSLIASIPIHVSTSEYGDSWHKAGMFENKQNVFDDFIAAAEHLIQNKYTNPQK